MEKLLDKPLDILKADFDSHSIDSLRFMGDVLAEFYTDIANSRSKRKFQENMKKIECLLEHAGRYNDVSNYRKTYKQILGEFSLTTLEGKSESKKANTKNVSGERKYRLYSRTLAPLPEESKYESE